MLSQYFGDLYGVQCCIFVEVVIVDEQYEFFFFWCGLVSVDVIYEVWVFVGGLQWCWYFIQYDVGCCVQDFVGVFWCQVVGEFGVDCQGVVCEYWDVYVCVCDMEIGQFEDFLVFVVEFFFFVGFVVFVIDEVVCEWDYIECDWCDVFFGFGEVDCGVVVYQVKCVILCEDFFDLIEQFLCVSEF